MNLGLRSVGKALAAALILGAHWSDAGELHPRDYAVELTARVTREPPEITLQWRGDPYARRYVIQRKAREDRTWTEVGTAAGHETWWVDRNVTSGVGYEYQVFKEGTLDYNGYGYIYSAIELPLVENRGRVILLTESEMAAGLAAELERLELDLIGDGWRVARRNVQRSQSSAEVKELIKAVYTEDPGSTRALILFGNVPVPYSGDIAPDQHPQHEGAWAADVFYGDMDGVWTDSIVNTTTAERAWNHNVPGDGKWDQSLTPTAVELRVGRVDLSRMTCFANKLPSLSELDLLRRYLDKDHRFRSGLLPTDARALVFDRIGDSDPEPLAAMAWRNFAPFTGSEIEEIGPMEYFPAVGSKTYLWTAVTAGGGFNNSDQVGTSDHFALYPVNAVFTMFTGSYYGDWDNESNFLRAVLGAPGRVLASMYSAQPQWICHTMALGEPIGDAAKLTQENGRGGLYPPHTGGAGEVHVGLMGDPTIRAHPVPQPRHVTGVREGGLVRLSWDAPLDVGVAGYQVLKAGSLKGEYQKVRPELVQERSIVLEAAETDYFMIKAVTLTTTPSGSYWNSSQGVYYPDPFAVQNERPPTAPHTLVITKSSPSAIELSWISSSVNHAGFIIERLQSGETEFREIARVPSVTLAFKDETLEATGVYRYRVKAWNNAGSSDYSNEAAASNGVGAAEFVGYDRVTQGNWIGRYGGEGYIIAETVERLASHTVFSVSNVYNFRTSPPNDVRGLEIPESANRSANCWVGVSPFALQFNFTDGKAHQVAIYLVSWSRQSAPLSIEAIDAATGQLLDKRELEHANEGIYVTYLIRNNVYIRISPLVWYTNGEVGGIFIDEVKVAPVLIEPGGGDFLGKTLVQLSCATPGVEIRYTLDGAEPGMDSARYTEPFWLFADANLRARAFKDGFEPSGVAAANFTNRVANRFEWIGWDTRSAGNWLADIGQEGFWVARGGKEFPAYAEAVIANRDEWVWDEAAYDERALFEGRSGENRIASSWFAAEELRLDLGVYDTKMRAIRLYFLDWDRTGRVQEVEFLDGAGKLLETVRVDDFGQGKYLVFGLQGHVRLRIRRVEGNNVVLSGMFFDEAPAGLNPRRFFPISNARLGEGSFMFSVVGAENEEFCVDGSADLANWSCLATNRYRGGPMELTLPVNGEKSRFHRAHSLP